MNRPLHSKRQSGFSLIELMVALVLALAVSAASVLFISAIIRSNAETIASTRLTQELRSLNEVIAREIRRARYIADPIANIGAGDDAAGMDVLDLSTAGCIRFGYQVPPGEAGAGDSEFRAIRLDPNSGTVLIGRGDADLGCANADTPISSGQLQVTRLDFAGAGPNRIDLAIGGALRTGSYTVERQFRASVFVRSGRVGG